MVGVSESDILLVVFLVYAEMASREAWQAKAGDVGGKRRGAESLWQLAKDLGPQPPPPPYMREISGVDNRVVSKRVVLEDVPPEGKQEQGYLRMFPGANNRNKGAFACSPGTKTGTRVRSPKPPFYETALLSTSENRYNVANWRSRRDTVHFLGAKMGHFRRFGTIKMRRDSRGFGRKMAYSSYLS